MTSTINSFRGDYRFLSNFEYSPVMFDNVQYPTIEHAYQAAKTDDFSERHVIHDAQTPRAARKLGQLVKIRPDWDNVKADVMLGLLRQKFAIPHLAQLLDETGDAELIEGNTWGDVFWGVCDGVGKNWLGRLLMQVREENRKNNVVLG